MADLKLSLVESLLARAQAMTQTEKIVDDAINSGVPAEDAETFARQFQISEYLCLPHRIHLTHSFEFAKDTFFHENA